MADTVEKVSDTSVKVTSPQPAKVVIESYALIKKRLINAQALVAKLSDQLAQADALGVVEAVPVKVDK
jgi:hypothetical protein